MPFHWEPVPEHHAPHIRADIVGVTSVRAYVIREVESRRVVVPGKLRRKFCILVYKALTYDYGTLRVCSLAPITTSSLPRLPRTNCAPFPRTFPTRCPIEKHNRLSDFRIFTWIACLAQHDRDSGTIALDIPRWCKRSWCTTVLEGSPSRPERFR